MILTIKHNGFHGINTVRINATKDQITRGIVPVSERTVKRINNAVCGISSCRCGEYIVMDDFSNNYAHIYIPLAMRQWAAEGLPITIKGWYPQD